LILRKIIKIVVTICQLLRLKCTNPAGSITCSAAQDPLAGFKGLTSKGEMGGEGGDGSGCRERREGRESVVESKNSLKQTPPERFRLSTPVGRPACIVHDRSLACKRSKVNVTRL